MYEAARNAFPGYCAMAAFWLWVLFLVRTMGLMMVVLVDVIPALTRQAATAAEPRAYFFCEPLLWVAIPLLLNLYLNHFRRMWRRLETMSVTLTIPPRLRRR